MSLSKQEITRLFKIKALELGFSGVAIAKAEYMEEEARHLEQWLNSGYHATMHYLEKHFDLKVDPTKLVPGAKSVVCLMYNYYTDIKQEDPEAPIIATYAYGRDYHKVVKAKNKQLFNYLKSIVGDVHGRTFVDSAPILERDWAKRSGLGWSGKNTLTIHPECGSYFFLSELICDYTFEYDMPIKDYCGTCTRCIDACPTEAISPQGYLVDSNKCISYITIERKDALPIELKGKMNNYMVGCDICQQVCPWNRFSKHHEEPQFLPTADLLNMSKSDWHDLSETTYDTLFEGSAVKRVLYDRLKRNIKFLS